jgi:hypothetical protein
MVKLEIVGAVNVLRTMGYSFFSDNFLLVGPQLANWIIGQNFEIELGAVIVELDLKRGEIIVLGRNSQNWPSYSPL